MRRGSVLLAALLLTGFVTTATISTASAPPEIAWTPCEEGSTVTCASVTVPIDYAHPKTGTIDVVFARSKATGRKHGTLVYLAGGPGDSGIDALLRGNVVPPRVAERFDIVSLDPRGTNRSHPIVCDKDLVQSLPNVVPEAGGRLADVQEYARDLGNSCREHTGPLVDHVDSISVARDVDAIRAALGEQRITVFGHSWGTLAGQMYAEKFPYRLQGMVLDSVFDHSLSPTPFITQSASFSEDAFAEFTKWCAANTTCVLHGQDPGQVYGDLWARSVNGALPLPPIVLARNVTSRLYGPNWPGLAEYLKNLSGTAAKVSAAETAPFPLAAFCTDNRVRIDTQQDWEAMWRKQSSAAPTLRAHFGFAVLSLCSGWPGATPNPQHATRLDRTAPPVLIMNSRHDPATGYAWARSVNRQLDRSVLLTYDGWGHGAIDRTDCTKAVFTEYVLSGTLPLPGAHCEAAA
jgi:pimeloyl-ACP methyl ester carboxylesterase